MGQKMDFRTTSFNICIFVKIVYNKTKLAREMGYSFPGLKNKFKEGMRMPLDPEIKQEIIKKFQRHPNDTGSPEVQIALLTARIKQLETHLKVHRKDFHSRRGLMKIIGQRRALLRYLKRTDFNRYQNLIKALGLKK